jgi:tetratricopeptide (TPR) repeat protein
VATGGARAATTTRWREITGDLDAITLKALRPGAESRYASAAVFAADLRRWLAGKPVEARRGGRRYRAAKFARRHRLPVLSAALVIAALAAGVAGVLVQSRRAAQAAALAREQRDFALRQLSRAEAINDLNALLLSDVAPGGKPLSVGDLLGQAERILESQRGRADPNRAEILVAIGRQYDTREETTKARRLLTEAYELSRGTAEHGTAARAACALAGAVVHAEEFDRAEALLREGLEQLPDGPQFVLPRVFCLLLGGSVARNAGKPDEAVTRIEQASRLLAESGQGSELLALSADLDLAESYRQAGRLLQADVVFADVWSRLEAMGRGDTERAGTLLNNWALVQRALGRPLDAERNFRRAVRIGSADAAATGVSPLLLNNLARTMMDLGHLDEAKDDAERAYDLARRAGNEGTITQSIFLRSLIAVRLGDLPRAATLMAELKVRVGSLPDAHPYQAIFAMQKAMLDQARGDVDGARAGFDRAIALADPSARYIVHLQRSEFALATHRPAEAAADASEALAYAQKNSEPGSLSNRIGLAQLALAKALRDQGKLSDARAAAAVAVKHLEPTLSAGHAATRAARELAGNAGEPTK